MKAKGKRLMLGDVLEAALRKMRANPVKQPLIIDSWSQRVGEKVYRFEVWRDIFCRHEGRRRRLGVDADHDAGKVRLWIGLGAVRMARIVGRVAAGEELFITHGRPRSRASYADAFPARQPRKARRGKPVTVKGTRRASS